MQINNVKELRDELADVFGKLRDGKYDCAKADSLANVAGKMISSSVAQIKYYEQRKESPEISFLNEK